MSITDIEARAEINALISTAWVDAEAIAGDDLTEPLFYKGKEETRTPKNYWARVSHQIVDQDQASHADDNTYVNAKRRFETNGLVFVQLFAPKTEKNAYKKGAQIGEILRKALRAAGSSGNVWLMHARLEELTDDGSHWRWNVIAETSYDTIE